VEPETKTPRVGPRLWLPIAAVAGVLVLLVYAWSSGVFGTGADRAASSSYSSEEEHAHADALRAEAASALEAGQWARVIALLDEAKALDPRGDKAVGAQYAREIAAGKLGLRDAAR
jgi:hypothetical protein